MIGYLDGCSTRMTAHASAPKWLHPPAPDLSPVKGSVLMDTSSAYFGVRVFDYPPITPSGYVWSARFVKTKREEIRKTQQYLRGEMQRTADLLHNTKLCASFAEQRGWCLVDRALTSSTDLKAQTMSGAFVYAVRLMKSSSKALQLGAVYLDTPPDVSVARLGLDIETVETSIQGESMENRESVVRFPPHSTGGKRTYRSIAITSANAHGLVSTGVPLQPVQFGSWMASMSTPPISSFSGLLCGYPTLEQELERGLAASTTQSAKKRNRREPMPEKVSDSAGFSMEDTLSLLHSLNTPQAGDIILSVDGVIPRTVDEARAMMEVKRETSNEARPAISNLRSSKGAGDRQQERDCVIVVLFRPALTFGSLLHHNLEPSPQLAAATLPSLSLAKQCNVIREQGVSAFQNKCLLLQRKLHLLTGEMESLQTTLAWMEHHVPSGFRSMLSLPSLYTLMHTQTGRWKGEDETNKHASLYSQLQRGTLVNDTPVLVRDSRFDSTSAMTAVMASVVATQEGEQYCTDLLQSAQEAGALHGLHLIMLQLTNTTTAAALDVSIDSSNEVESVGMLQRVLHATFRYNNHTKARQTVPLIQALALRQTGTRLHSASLHACAPSLSTYLHRLSLFQPGHPPAFWAQQNVDPIRNTSVTALGTCMPYKGRMEDTTWVSSWACDPCHHVGLGQVGFGTGAAAARSSVGWSIPRRITRDTTPYEPNVHDILALPCENMIAHRHVDEQVDDSSLYDAVSHATTQLLQDIPASSLDLPPLFTYSNIQRAATVSGHRGHAMFCLGYDTTGHNFISGGDDGLVKVWYVQPL
jgi:hypothetical protein